MVWVKRDKKLLTKARDSKIVRNDFIIAESFASTFSFLDKDSPDNIFGKSFFTPVFQVMKVHRNHPIRITSSNQGYNVIYPVSEDNTSRKNFRFPAEVYKDKMNYDVASFMMVPYDTSEIGSAWKKDLVEEGGFVTKYGEWQGKSLSLLYLDHKLEISEPYLVSEVMPSQVLPHLLNWMHAPKEIHSYGDLSGQNLEGRVAISREKCKEFYDKFKIILEARFKTYLGFKRD